MQRVGEHFVPAGPLAVRWLAYELQPLRAGAVSLARVAFENAGAAAWRQLPGERIMLSYHWLDGLGNPIVWDGLWRTLAEDVAPGGQVELYLEVRAPMPPGRYRLALDLLDEGRCWFAEIGSTPLELDVTVEPRIPRALAVVSAAVDEATSRALAGQDERLVPPEDAAATAHLAAGCVPAHDWSRRVLDAHQEGFAVVGPAIAAAGRRLRHELAAWAPGGGRNPIFGEPLLCPSVVAGVEPVWLEDVAGLPAAAHPEDEPWIYEGRAVVRAPRRSGRRSA